MSPRAAWRLEAIGFVDVYDYRPGKADWLAAGLAFEGTETSVERTGQVAETVPTCRIDETVSQVRSRLNDGICVVVNDQDVVLGLVTFDNLKGTDELVIEDVMQEGPSTWRPHLDAAELRHYLAHKGVDWVLITTADGKLVGVFSTDETH